MVERQLSLKGGFSKDLTFISIMEAWQSLAYCTGLENQRGVTLRRFESYRFRQFQVYPHMLTHEIKTLIELRLTELEENMSDLNKYGITKESFHPEYEECFCRHDELSKMLNCIE